MSIFAHHPEAWDQAEVIEVRNILSSIYDSVYGIDSSGVQFVIDQLAEAMQHEAPATFGTLLKEMDADVNSTAMDLIAGV
jgi:hypothetical protein